MWLIRYLKTVRECLYKEDEMTNEEANKKIDEYIERLNILEREYQSEEDLRAKLNELCYEIIQWCEDNE